MSHVKPNQYTAEFKASAVKLAVESDQPISKTAEELGLNKNTLHTWISKYHRARNPKSEQVEELHLYEELKQLRKENRRLLEERELLKKRRRTLRRKSGEVRLHDTTPAAR